MEESTVKTKVEILLAPKADTFRRYFELCEKLDQTIREAKSILNDMASLEGMTFEVTGQSDKLSQNHYRIRSND